ncbi:protealysin inhibitor emfourin [Micromonospora vulcania]
MITLMVAVLAGCTSADPVDTTPNQPPVTATSPPSSTAPTTSGAPAPTSPGTGATGAAGPVQLTRSGGFAGRGDRVTVEPDGRWTAVDRAGSRRTGKLSAADLGRLRGLAADPRLASESRVPTASTGCADAFTYRLSVGTIETGYVDCPSETTPPPATRALVELLLRATA